MQSLSSPYKKLKQITNNNWGRKLISKLVISLSNGESYALYPEKDNPICYDAYIDIRSDDDLTETIIPCEDIVYFSVTYSRQYYEIKRNI